ncbi:MAG: AAA family ATPase, partial [Candidatus Syntrophoarchaeum sp.]|nr:AAA family ATPase [Candidatus Syntrophoarchaeum sp.]
MYFSKKKKWIERREILAIKGPRQSGKTTLLEMLKEVLEGKIREENIIFLTFE